MRSAWRATAQALAWAGSLALAVLPPKAQAMPTQEAFEAAVHAARPEAAKLGLQLRTDGLWRQLLISRTPLLAGAAGAQCFIAYSPYTPSQSYGWLFPDLPPDDAATWLAALVRHEMAHCHEPVWAGGDAAGAGQRRREVYADLAFAQHAITHSARGRELVARLAALRAARAGQDPLHNTSAALQCYLSQAGQTSAPPGDLRAQLVWWRDRCTDHQYAAAQP